MSPKNFSNRKKVGVCLTPALMDQFEVDQSIVVVIDILRATTSMCVAFDNGVQTLLPVLNVETCRQYRDKGYFIAAERNGEQIPGFDFGNSPYSFMGPEIQGEKVAMSTTNGTHALNVAREHNAKEIVIGSFANISVLTDYLISRNENVILLCAGWKDRPNLEDTIFAGAMVKRLRGSLELFEDTALIAETLFKMASRRKRYYMNNSSHYHRIVYTLQIQKDVKYALRRDTHPVIPILVGDHLILHEDSIPSVSVPASKKKGLKLPTAKGKKKGTKNVKEKPKATPNTLPEAEIVES